MAEGSVAQLFIKLSAISGLESNIIYTVCICKIDSFGKEWLENTYTGPLL